MPTEPGIYWCRFAEEEPDGPWDGFVVVTGQAPFLSCVARELDNPLTLVHKTDPATIIFGPRMELPARVNPSFAPSLAP